MHIDSQVAKHFLNLSDCVALFCMQVEDLKQQLETCHQQLAESNHNKHELEEQLRTALEREQHIRSGYISPVSMLAATLAHHCSLMLRKSCCVLFILCYSRILSNSLCMFLNKAT